MQIEKWNLYVGGASLPPASEAFFEEFDPLSGRRSCRIALDATVTGAVKALTFDSGEISSAGSRCLVGRSIVNVFFAGGVEKPSGGHKRNGHGREKGIEALHHYIQLKCVTVRL